MANVGTATINFGAAPGSSRASVVVSDANILSNSYAEAWLMADTTSDHNGEEHELIAGKVSFTCGSVQAGVGFTIYAVSDSLRLTGAVQVRWIWA